MARNDALWYRTSKFVVRHKAGVSAAATITLILLVGLAITLHEFQVARVERARAEQRFRDMRELARSNLFEFHDAIQNLPGSAAARNLVIQRALGYLDKLSHDETGDRELMDDLAAGYERVASLQADFSGPGMGNLAAAATSYQKAFTIRESLLADAGHDVAELKAQSNLLDGYAIVLEESGRITEATRLARRDLQIAEELATQAPHDRENIIREADAHLQVAFVMGGNGSAGSTRELPESIAHGHQAVNLLLQLPQANPDPALIRALVRAEWTLAYHLRKNRQFDESLKVYSEIWSVTHELQVLPIRAQALMYNHRCRLFDDMGDVRRAYEDGRKALALANSMVQSDSHDLIAQIYTAVDLGTLGINEARLGNASAGMKKVDEAVDTGERLIADNPHQLFFKGLLVIGYTYQAEIFSSIGDQAKAQAKYIQALNMATELAQTDAQDLDSRLNIAKIHVALGVVTARAGRHDKAQQELSTGLSQLEQFLEIRAQDAEALYTRDAAHNNLASLRGCVTARICQTVRTMHLPVLNN